MSIVLGYVKFLINVLIDAILTVTKV